LTGENVLISDNSRKKLLNNTTQDIFKKKLVSSSINMKKISLNNKLDFESPILKNKPLTDRKKKNKKFVVFSFDPVVPPLKIGNYKKK
jgi:hypothetical protein